MKDFLVCSMKNEWILRKAKSIDLLLTVDGLKVHDTCALACRRCIELNMKSELTDVAEDYGVCKKCVKLWNTCEMCGTFVPYGQPFINGIGLCCIQ